MKGRNIPFKKNMIQGGATVLAALILGIFMVCTVKTLKSYDDTVKVRGLCEKEVPADRDESVPAVCPTCKLKIDLQDPENEKYIVSVLMAD